jgi:hypothetical protein
MIDVTSVVLGVVIGVIFTAGLYEKFLRPKTKLTDKFYDKVREAQKELLEISKRVDQLKDEEDKEKGGDKK